MNTAPECLGGKGMVKSLDCHMWQASPIFWLRYITGVITRPGPKTVLKSHVSNECMKTDFHGHKGNKNPRSNLGVNSKWWSFCHSLKAGDKAWTENKAKQSLSSCRHDRHSFTPYSHSLLWASPSTPDQGHSTCLCFLVTIRKAAISLGPGMPLVLTSMSFNLGQAA